MAPGNSRHEDRRTCPSCQSKLLLHARSRAKYFGCSECRNILEISGASLNVTGRRFAEFEIFLQTGQQVVFDGIQYTVIGAVLKSVKNTLYQWTEYCLFNPSHPLAYLSEMKGHWHLVIPGRHVFEKPDFYTRKWRGREFSLFNSDTVITKGFIGEYPGDPQGENKYSEFISPPYLLSEERYPDGIIQFVGRYITHEELKTAAPEIAKPKLPQGVGAAQPSPFPLPFKTILQLYGLYAILLLAIALISWNRSYLLTDALTTVSAKSAANSIPVPPEKVLTDKPESDLTISPEFQVPNSHTAIGIDFSSDVNNSWIAIEGTLVNQVTGEQLTFWKDLEYYYGYEDGTNWTEGSKESSVILSGVKKGSYRLLIEADQASGQKEKQLHTSIYCHPHIHSNLILFLILGLIHPLIFYALEHNFEKRRWSNSDYSPYESDE